MDSINATRFTGLLSPATTVVLIYILPHCGCAHSEALVTNTFLQDTVADQQALATTVKMLTFTSVHSMCDPLFL